MGELARGHAPARPLSSVSAYLDWKRFGVPPYATGTREWPADFLDEWRYIADALAEAREVLSEGRDDDGGDGMVEEE